MTFRLDGKGKEVEWKKELQSTEQYITAKYSAVQCSYHMREKATSKSPCSIAARSRRRENWAEGSKCDLVIADKALKTLWLLPRALCVNS